MYDFKISWCLYLHKTATLKWKQPCNSQAHLVVQREHLLLKNAQHTLGKCTYIHPALYIIAISFVPGICFIPGIFHM
jgi:hypothetical protein